MPSALGRTLLPAAERGGQRVRGDGDGRGLRVVCTFFAASRFGRSLADTAPFSPPAPLSAILPACPAQTAAITPETETRQRQAAAGLTASQHRPAPAPACQGRSPASLGPSAWSEGQCAAASGPAGAGTRTRSRRHCPYRSYMPPPLRRALPSASTHSSGAPRRRPSGETRVQHATKCRGRRRRPRQRRLRGRQARASSPAPAACLPTFNTVSLTSSFPSNTPSVPSPAAFRRTGIWIQAVSTNRPCGRTSEPIGPLAALHSEVGRQYSMDVSPRNRPPTGGAPAPAPREMRAGLRRAGVRGVWEGCVRPVRTECARPVHACRRRVGRAGWGES